MRRVELLAPAKDFESLCAAVDHGADAVYMGGVGFGARSGACNSIEDVARSVEYAHQYGVKLYATLNTLLYDHELEGAKAHAEQLRDVGVDAFIVQDMAYARMGLGVELHASTQMCNMTVEGVRFLSDCGFRRVVLERNLSLSQMRKIAQGCDAEIEAFVHGAICVGYSGRCYLSRSMSERSGNRGECSQPCRLSYNLVDANGDIWLKNKHLLSVKDLDLSAHIGDMLDAGVSSFKIEGRLKDLGYIKNVVSHYRRMIDAEIARRGDVCRSSAGRTYIDFEPNPAKSFSRASTTYTFRGIERGVASFETPKAIGERVGKVLDGSAANYLVEGAAQLASGDGLCFYDGEKFTGGNVNRVVAQRDGSAWVTLNRAAKLKAGDTLYRNFDRLFEAALGASKTRRRVAVSAALQTTPTGVLLTYKDIDGYTAQSQLSQQLDKASNMAKMESTICDQLAKCGDTIFELAGSVDLSAWGGEFVAASVLAKMRREALESLRGARVAAAAAQGEPFVEGVDAKYPSAELGGEVGVTNAMAEAFYRDHGVRRITPSWESAESLQGAEVMVSSYCIRREIGECLREGSPRKGDLMLVRGKERLALSFDCGRCRMKITKM